MPVLARALAALALAALVAATVGCSAGQHPRASSSGTSQAGSSAATPPGATPSAFATPWPAGLTFPPGPFADGNCEKLLTSTTVGNALGNSHKATVIDEDAAVAAVGGISCEYTFGQDEGSDDVRMEVAPSAIADPDEVTASLAPTYCGFDNSDPGVDPCTTTGVVGGWWYNLSDTTSTSRSLKSKQASFAVIKADLSKALGAVTAPTQVRALQRFDCDAPIISRGLVGSASDSRYDEQYDGEIIAAAHLWSGSIATCYFTMPDNSTIGVAVHPGGASVYGQCTHSYSIGEKGAEVSVPGVQTAFSISSSYTHEICATDGRSAVEVNVVDTGGNDNYSWTTDRLSDLGALLVSMFAAAAPPRTARSASVVGSAAPAVASPLAGGDCAKLLGTKTLGVEVGASGVTVAGQDPLLATVGGIDCDYNFERLGTTDAALDDGLDVAVQVAPSAIVDGPERAASLQTPSCDANPFDGSDDYNEVFCTETIVVAGWWYSVTFNDSADRGDANLQALASISQALEKILTTTAAPKSVGVARSFVCPTADSAGAPVTSSRTMMDDLNDTSSPIRAAAFLLVGPVACEFTLPHSHQWPYGDEWALTVYPKNTSAYLGCIHGQLAPGSKTISIPGVKTAIALGGFSPYFQQVCATDGTSTVYAADADLNGWPFKAATMQTLSSLLVPVFAAAG